MLDDTPVIVMFNTIPTDKLPQLFREDTLLCHAVLTPLNYQEECNCGTGDWNYMQEGLEALARIREEAPVSILAEAMLKMDEYIRTGYKWGWYWREDYDVPRGLRPIKRYC